jgi:hypothetical protein
LTTTLTQLAGSAEPVQFAISAIDDQGNPFDPTIYQVSVAFAPVTSPQAPFVPSSATWNPAAWSTQPGNPEPVYWVNITPGPGGVVVAAGPYKAYVMIETDAPDGVVLLAAYVNFL